MDASIYTATISGRLYANGTAGLVIKSTTIPQLQHSIYFLVNFPRLRGYVRSIEQPLQIFSKRKITLVADGSC